MLMKSSTLALFAASLLMTTLPLSDAHAQAAIFEVVHPEVEKGEVEVEVLNGIGISDVEDGEERSAHEFAIGYGLTDFWKFTAAFELANPRGESAEVEAFELENLIILPFFGGGHHDDDDGKEEGGHPEFTLGFFTALEIPREDGIDEGAIEFGPVFETELGSLEWVGNFFIEAPFAEGDPGIAYASQIVYPINDTIGVGIENFGEVEGLFGSDETESEHFIGPAVYFEAELPNGHVLEPRAAILFGIGEEAPDAVLSLNLEYKFGGK